MTREQHQPDPMTALLEGMVALHESFLAAIAAGFNEQQAMSIVIRLAIEAQKGPEQ